MDADISPPHAPTGNEKDHLFSVQVLRPRSMARDSRSGYSMAAYLESTAAQIDNTDADSFAWSFNPASATSTKCTGARISWLWIALPANSPTSSVGAQRMTALFGVVVKADPSTLKSVFVLCEILMSRLVAFPARGRHQFNDILPTSGVKP
jgi:hypothetical protein